MTTHPSKKNHPGTDNAQDYKHYFTVFIPTYNRAWTLEDTFNSIEKLTLRDFEVLIVDDGSTDGTREMVADWQNRVPFPVKYVYQENGGKCRAHNTALEHADGFFFFNLDADDLILPDALNQIKNHWEDIPEKDRDNFSGICGLMLTNDGTISGAPFDRDIIDSDFNEIYSISTMKNEKKWAVRTSVFRQYPYPSFEGEKYLRQTLVLRRLSHHYKMRFINIPLQKERYRPDGLTSNIFWHHYNSPGGQRLYYLEEITLNDRYHKPKKQYRLHVHYVRFSLHAGVGFLAMAKEVKHPLIWLLALPRGTTKWLSDRVRARVSR